MPQRRRADIPFVYGQRQVAERRHRFYDRRHHHGPTRIFHMGFDLMLSRFWSWLSR